MGPSGGACAVTAAFYDCPEVNKPGAKDIVSQDPATCPPLPPPGKDGGSFTLALGLDSALQGAAPFGSGVQNPPALER